MRFEAQVLVPAVDAVFTTPDEFGVYAVDPLQGNDAALLAVFDNAKSPQELATFLNWMYDQYMHAAPMRSTIA